MSLRRLRCKKPNAPYQHYRRNMCRRRLCTKGTELLQIKRRAAGQKINLRNGRKQLRRANNKLELLEELSRALTTPEQGGTFALGMGNPRGRENSMLVVAVAIGACAMAFIAVRSHRRANERLYVDESTPLLSRRGYVSCNFEILSILSPTTCAPTLPVASGRSVAIGRTVTHRAPGD